MKVSPSPEFALQVRAEPLSSGLQTLVLRPCRGVYASFTHILLLDSGRVEVVPVANQTGIEAPAGVILPVSPALTLTLGPGRSGWLLGLSPLLLSNAIGAGPESELMTPVGSHLIIARDFRPTAQPAPETLVQGIMAELEGGAPGSQLAVLALMRLILIAIWRASRVEVSAPGFGSELHMLEGFRRLVEVHFRNHMRIRDYAASLGVTESRLRRICQRNLARSPQQLVHLRLMREAATWLERSGKSAKEVAQALGFADSAEFSHFFKRNSGLSPRQYREEIRGRAPGSKDGTASFEDWP